MKITAAFLIFLGLFVTPVAFGQQKDLVVEGPGSAARIDTKILEEGKLLISVDDSAGNAITGLTKKDFSVSKDGKLAKILSVEPLETSSDVGLNIVLVIDNSFSMKLRKAVEPVLSAMDNILKIIRPIDNFTVVTFQDGETSSFDEYKLHVETKQSSDYEELKSFLHTGYGENLTEKTYLYEAMLAGISIASKMPADENKFMVVFSDGEDINSAFESSLVEKAARFIPNFEVYAIDYMPEKDLDPFLNSFTLKHGGKTWKANEAADLAPVFEEVSSKLIHRYVLTYKFLFPPEGFAAFTPGVVNVEEITTIDSSPMLNYIYFDTGDGVIPGRYNQFSRQDDIRSFSERALRGSLEKYHDVLNVIGARLRKNPDARISLTGCNSNYGVEKGRTDLSRARAESVKAYLQYIWGIGPDRMEVVARNLPAVPSTNRIEEGRAENQRVEIHCDHPDILAPVQSTYMEIRSDAKSIQLIPRIASEHGLDSWKITFLSNSGPFWTLDGEGAFNETVVLPSDVFTPEKLSKLGQLKAKVFVTDAEGQTFETAPPPVKINFIQREQRRAQNLGYMVEEKYALILFDFDRAEIKERNAAIVGQIVDRTKTRMEAAVNIVGHTDNIGKADYNIKLSERRAKAVYDQIVSAMGEYANRAIQYSGVGQADPLYPNDFPENRALNRTVTITLVYESME